MVSLCWYSCVGVLVLAFLCCESRKKKAEAELARNAQGCRQDDRKRSKAREGAFAAPSRQESDAEEGTQSMELQPLCRDVLCQDAILVAEIAPGQYLCVRIEVDSTILHSKQLAHHRAGS
jgi:hypothetical protein